MRDNTVSTALLALAADWTVSFLMASSNFCLFSFEKGLPALMCFWKSSRLIRAVSVALKCEAAGVRVLILSKAMRNYKSTSIKLPYLFNIALTVLWIDWAFLPHLSFEHGANILVK